MAVDWTPVIEAAVAATKTSGGVYRRKWSTIKKTAGGKNVTYEQRKDLAAQLRAAGVAVTPHLDGTAPQSGAYVTMIDADEQPPENLVRFSSERPLEDLIRSAMPSMPGLPGVDFVAQQASMGNKRADLLGRKGVAGGRTRWYVIEVERDNTKESVEQVALYGRKFREKGAVSKDIGKGEGAQAIRPKDNDEITLVVIAQAGNTDDQHDKLAAQLRGAAEAEGFHSKWIVLDITAHEIPAP